MSKRGFPGGTVVKNPSANVEDARDTDSIPGSGRSGVGNGNPLQYSCLENLSQIPNKVIDEALKNKKVKGLEEYTNILREKTFGKSRFDFKIAKDNGQEYFLEVKGVTLEEYGYSRFPDAPTERGARHLLELVEAKKQGYGAGVMFLIQLEDINKFSPNDIRDKEFGEALRFAKSNGVDIFAYNCIVTEEGIEINKEVEIIL